MYLKTLATGLLSVASSGVLAAQTPAGPPISERGGRAPAAQMLLAHTGELDLTDAQVVKLAAIARRNEARRRSMRAAFDSTRQRFERPAPTDTAARRQMRERMRADMQRIRDQSRVDERDAIAVLTADQQARAWDLVARGGAGSRSGMRGMRGRAGGMRGGMRGMRPRGRMPRFDRPGPRLRPDSTRQRARPDAPQASAPSN